MQIEHFHAVYIFVNEPLESATWYSKVFEIPLSISENNFALIQIGKNELCFHKADEKSPVSPGGSVGYWKVLDLKNAMDKFIDNGGVVYRGPIEIPETDEGICQIKDPLGSVIGLQGYFNK